MTKYTFRQTNNATGFAKGDLWESEDQLNDYFKVETLKEIGIKNPPSQEVLQEMKLAVVENRWHCVDNFKLKVED